MMKYFVDTYNRTYGVEVRKNDKLESSSGKKYQLDVKIDGNEMVIDNSTVHRSTKDGRPTIRFNKKLALKMKWFEATTYQHQTMSNIKLGPYLIMNFYDPTIPDVLDASIQTIETAQSFSKKWEMTSNSVCFATGDSSI